MEEKMDITITQIDVGLLLIGAAILVLIIYCIAFMKNLVVTVKHANRILEDAQVISKIAADRAQDVDKVVSDIADSVGNISDSIKSNQNPISAFTAIIGAFSAIKNMVQKNK